MKHFTTRIFNCLMFTSVLTFGSFLNAQNFERVSQFGGIDDDFGQDVVSDDDGNVFSTVYFYQAADFDPSYAEYRNVSRELSLQSQLNTLTI